MRRTSSIQLICRDFYVSWHIHERYGPYSHL
jgi:hypothetical protein